MRPGRSTSSPAASRARWCRRPAARARLRARRHRRLAVRRVLPGGRRPGRDDRARAAAARRARATSAWREWVEQRLLPLRGLRDPEDAGRARRAYWDELDTPGRFLLTKLIGGGFRVGVSKLLVQRALAEARRHRCQAGRAAHDGLHRRQGRRRARSARGAHRADADAGPRGRRPALSRSSSRTSSTHRRRSSRHARSPADWLVEWKYDGIRGQLVKRARPGLDLVARRGAGDRALSGDRGAGRGRCPTAPCSTARSWSGRTTQARAVRACCSSASAARR